MVVEVVQFKLNEGEMHGPTEIRSDTVFQSA